MSRVIATKGSATARMVIGAPSAVDVRANGAKLSRGYKVWTVGVGLVKGELYGWLGMDPPTSESGQPYPPGYCHFPEYGEDYFKQLTAEQLVEIRKRNGFIAHEWQIIPGRENHWLDCRVYARAAASLKGLDRMAAGRGRAQAAAPVAQSAQASPAEQTAQMSAVAPVRRPERPARSGWLSGGKKLSGIRGNWLSRR